MRRRPSNPVPRVNLVLNMIFRFKAQRFAMPVLPVVGLATSILALPALAQSVAETTSPAPAIVPPAIPAPATRTSLNWKPLDYHDLAVPDASAMPFAEIWADRLIENNQAYRKVGDTRFSLANAPASESDFIVASASDEVTLTVLNTYRCKILKTDLIGRATLKLCPMRLAEFREGRLHNFDSGEGCFLEFSPPPPGQIFDPARDATYAAYDASSHAIRLGTLINHKPVDACAVTVPIPQRYPNAPRISLYAKPAAANLPTAIAGDAR